MHKRRSNGGMTLLELLLASAAVALIGLAIVSMLFAVSYGTSSSDELRKLAVRSKSLNNRIGAAVRGSKMILDQGADFVVLWTRDLNEDGVPSLLEIRRLQRDDDDSELFNYVADGGAPDTVYALTDDFDAITTALMGTADFPGELWSTGVTGWDITLDDADPQLSTLVAYQMTLLVDGFSDVAINTVAVRSE